MSLSPGARSGAAHPNPGLAADPAGPAAAWRPGESARPHGPELLRGSLRFQGSSSAPLGPRGSLDALGRGSGAVWLRPQGMLRRRLRTRLSPRSVPRRRPAPRPQEMLPPPPASSPARAQEPGGRAGRGTRGPQGAPKGRGAAEPQAPPGGPPRAAASTDRAAEPRRPASPPAPLTGTHPTRGALAGHSPQWGRERALAHG